MVWERRGIYTIRDRVHCASLRPPAVAWIGPLIEQGHAPGLWTAHMGFEVALGWPLGIFLVETAERIAFPLPFWFSSGALSLSSVLLSDSGRGS